MKARSTRHGGIGVDTAPGQAAVVKAYPRALSATGKLDACLLKRPLDDDQRVHRYGCIAPFDSSYCFVTNSGAGGKVEASEAKKGSASKHALPKIHSIYAHKTSKELNHYF